MHCNDTITCAITPGAGRVLPTTASVFRAVRKEEFEESCSRRNAGRAGHCSGCPDVECSRSGHCSCGAAFDRNRCSDCGLSDSCRRRNACGCDDSCEAVSGRNGCADCSGGCVRNDPCGCSRENNCGCSGSHHSLTPGMVYEQEHDLCQLHEAGEAIRKGTLFPQLYMPMMGECADNCGAQLCEGQAEAFAAWELRLYLNTHPCDQQALQLFRKYARKADQPNYAGAFAGDCGDRWNWTEAPWPWEFNAGCECGCNCE